MTIADLENEDILSDSLEFLGGKPWESQVTDDYMILYGPLVLSLMTIKDGVLIWYL
ncbi:hypothetical protein BYT27DRAFT_7190435 [Phlegmacium glaucopus]|nr:hypothetical protein BYT27DRAFT_7190435 [Phlegmacium glaucopus]